jgi:protein-S-isoprenylcysteine O-methyltransferase Ste14
VIAGFVILYPSLQAGVWLVLYCFAAHLMVAAEEEYLGRIFKAAYRDYCRRVPRYFPFPRLGGILAEIKKE